MLSFQNASRSALLRIRNFKIVRSLKQHCTQHRWKSARSSSHLLSHQRRCCSKQSEDEDASPARTFFNFINKHIDDAPLGMSIGFIVSRLCLWFTLQRVLVACNFLCGPELAVGYMVARVTGKFRQPLNVAIAVGLSKLFPVFQILQISKLLGLDQQNRTPTKKLSEDEIEEIKQQLLRIGVTEREMEMFEYQDGKFNSVQGGLEKVHNWLAAPLNSYGLSFFLSMRATNWLTIISVATMINQGVDVVGYIQSWGISKDIGENFGALAGAVLINAPLFPLHMYIATHISPLLDSRMKGLMQAGQDKHPWEAFLEEKIRQNEFKTESEAPNRPFIKTNRERPPKL